MSPEAPAVEWVLESADTAADIAEMARHVNRVRKIFSGISGHLAPKCGLDVSKFYKRILRRSLQPMISGGAGEHAPRERTELEPSANWQKVSIPRAAEILKVSERSVVRSKTVIDHGAPDLITAVDCGDLTP